MCASEPGQDLRRPWSIIDDRGPEEDETPFDGMFGDHVPSTPAAPHLAFMETSVEEALAEYHREIDKLWLPAPTAALPDDDAPAPAKPLPKRGRFAPEMHDLPGFKEFMRDEAVKVFVPSNLTAQLPLIRRLCTMLFRLAPPIALGISVSPKIQVSK